ncbi:uncharacterized protein A4U43_C03F13820 [Asparagus officinalis]|uniref:Uncharacterized protein n=1 Tax=Asparagus officinalis TaxID=4686 RepID=A0A5P1FAR7_ASPOF|nr:uncharacterized protein A4U43_C03F13820 [Asparagus officinalis]
MSDSGDSLNGNGGMSSTSLEPVSGTGDSAESENFTEKLDGGSSSSGDSFSEKRQKGMLAIEIPRRAAEGFSSTLPAEGIKSPALERLRSLRRILSRGSLNSPRGNSDIEQGTAIGLQKNLPVSESATHANEKVVEIAVETQGENSVNKSNEEGSSSYMGSFPPPPSSSSRKRKEGMLMIDIPSRANGAFSSSNAPLSSSRVPSDSPLPTSRLLEEIKSPVMGRMKSLKRMLSRGRMSFKGVGTSYTSMGSDIEQGGVSDYKCR